MAEILSRDIIFKETSMNQIIYHIRRQTGRRISQREDISHVGDNLTIFLRYVLNVSLSRLLIKMVF